MKKEYVIFAGVNGAGKSTFYNIGKNYPKERVNSDEILRENNGDWRNVQHQAIAMKEAVKRINEYIKKGVSFNQETTLTGNSIINNIKKAKEYGYQVNVYYVGLDSADLAIQRVSHREKNGGHGIEEADIRRRYENSLNNLQKIIPMCDKIEVYDNTTQFTHIATYEQGRQTFVKDCAWLQKALDSQNEKTNIMDSKREFSKGNQREQHRMGMKEWTQAVNTMQQNHVKAVGNVRTATKAFERGM